MADNTYKLWCTLQGNNAIFPAVAPSTMSIGELKDIIKEKNKIFLQGVDAASLTLWKVDVDLKTVNTKIQDVGQYQPGINDQQELLPFENIIDIWSESPPGDHLHVFIGLPMPRPPGGSFNRPHSQPLHQTPPGIYLRSSMVSALYKKLMRYSFILVGGTPATGKTTLAQLLEQHIMQQEPAICVIQVYSWPLEEVRKAGGWRGYLRDRGWVQGRKTVFIFDEAQDSYCDSQLWGGFLKDIHDYEDLFAIAFASRGNPSSRLDLPDTIFAISDMQRVTLRSIDHGDGIDAVGLLFTRMEFDGLVRQRFSSSEYYFHPSFFDAVFELTGGHVGAILDLMQSIIVHDSYRLLKNAPPGQLYTWDLFLAKVNPLGLLVQLKFSTNMFKWGLPLVNDLQELAVAHVFSHVLCAGSIVKSCLTTKEDVAALKKCFLNGWLHADKRSDSCDDDETVYAFPSPLHRWCVEWKMFYSIQPSPVTTFQPNNILEFALRVIAGFSPHLLSAERRIGPGCIPRPPEAQYQDEFYRSCHVCLNGPLVTFPEYDTKKGRVDFYIPSLAWGVELVREDDRLVQHCGRFSQPGSYVTNLPLSDYIILDCHTTVPKCVHLDKENLYHVVFSNDYQDVSILDHLLQPVDGGEMRLLPL